MIYRDFCSSTRYLESDFHRVIIHIIDKQLQFYFKRRFFLFPISAFYIANNFGKVITPTSDTFSESVFNTPFQSIMDVFVMSLGDVDVIYREISNSPNSNVAKV